jgi:hypothetical protein
MSIAKQTISKNRKTLRRDMVDSLPVPGDGVVAARVSTFCGGGFVECEVVATEGLIDSAETTQSQTGDGVVLIKARMPNKFKNVVFLKLGSPLLLEVQTNKVLTLPPSSSSSASTSSANVSCPTTSNDVVPSSSSSPSTASTTSEVPQSEKEKVDGEEKQSAPTEIVYTTFEVAHCLFPNQVAHIKKEGLWPLHFMSEAESKKHTQQENDQGVMGGNVSERLLQYPNAGDESDELEPNTNRKRIVESSSSEEDSD